MVLSERIKAILDYAGKNASQFSRFVGFPTPQTVRELLKGNTKSVSDSVKYKIADAYPEINIEWLVTGDGEMLKPKDGIRYEDNAVFEGRPKYYLDDDVRQVRMFTVTPTATFTEMASCFNDDSSLVSIIPERGEFIDESYAIFEIRGESMEPTVRDHAKILCKEMPESRWYDAEGVVVISYKDRVVLKRILRNSLFTDNTITIGSDNEDPKYSGKDTVQLSDIHAIFKAKRILSQDIN